MQIVSSNRESQKSFLKRVEILLLSLVNNENEKAFTFNGKDFYKADEIVEFVEMDLFANTSKIYYIIFNVDKYVNDPKKIKKIKSLQKKKAKLIDQLRKKRKNISKLFKEVKPEELQKKELKNIEKKVNKLRKEKDLYENLKELKKLLKKSKGKEKTKIQRKINNIEQKNINIRKVNKQLETFEAILNYKNFFEDLVTNANELINSIDQKITAIEEQDKDSNFFIVDWLIM